MVYRWMVGIHIKELPEKKSQPLLSAYGYFSLKSQTKQNIVPQVL